MPHPGRSHIYQTAINRMVNQALEAQEQEFIRNRGGDSDAQLLAYLRFCAQLLEHIPWPREIVGGSLMEERFGSWEAALTKAGLPGPTTPDKITEFARYREEVERQKQVCRDKKAAKKQRAQQRMLEQKEKQSV